MIFKTKPGPSIGGPLVLAPAARLEKIKTIGSCVDQFYVDVTGSNATEWASWLVPGLKIREVSPCRARVGPLTQPQAHFFHKKVIDQHASYESRITSLASTTQQLLDSCDSELSGEHYGTVNGIAAFAGNWTVSTIDLDESGAPVRMTLCSADYVAPPVVETPDPVPALEIQIADLKVQIDILKKSAAATAKQPEAEPAEKEPVKKPTPKRKTPRASASKNKAKK